MNNKYKIIYYYSTGDDCYLAFAPELPGCCSDGKTVTEAVANLCGVIDEWVEISSELGRGEPALMPEKYVSSQADIFGVSKYILTQTGNISSMALEKLAYYCLVWSLVWYDNPLFANKFQAWKNGPVCKELFDAHKGRRIVSADMIKTSGELSADEKK